LHSVPETRFLKDFFSYLLGTERESNIFDFKNIILLLMLTELSTYMYRCTKHWKWRFPEIDSPAEVFSFPFSKLPKKENWKIKTKSNVTVLKNHFCHID